MSTETEKDYFVFSLSQKIGLPNYSNIDIFSSIGRNIEDNDEERQKVIDKVTEILEAQVDIIQENLNLK